MSHNSTSNTPPSTPQVITITAHHHIPVKLTSTNYTSWRAHFIAVLNGFDLTGHIDGSKPAPPHTDPDFAAWFRQDQLIRVAIFGSITGELLPLVTSASTAATAWSTLARVYAGKSRSRVFQLKIGLTTTTIGNRSVTEFLQLIKSKADELGLIDHPVSDDDLTLYVLNGLVHSFRDIASPIHSRETPLKFEELHDLLVEHEVYLKRLEADNSSIVATAQVARSTSQPHFAATSSPGSNARGGHNKTRGGGGFHSCGGRGSPVMGGNNRGHGGQPTLPDNRPPIVCQWCGFKGHTATTCGRLTTTANVAQSPTLALPNNSWLVDSGASHSLTNDLSKLSIHSEYDGTDEIQIADGTGLPITHTGLSNGGAAGARSV